jgi:hypothetical protein
MLDPKDAASAVLPACAESVHARIIEIRMRTMAQPLAFWVLRRQMPSRGYSHIIDIQQYVPYGRG